MPIIRRSDCVPLPQAGNILHTVHTSCQPTLQHHNSYNRTDNYRQCNAVGSPDDGHKDARNMLRYYWLAVNHYLLHVVGFTVTYLSKMHGHSNIQLSVLCSLALFMSVMLRKKQGTTLWNELYHTCLNSQYICTLPSVFLLSRRSSAPYAAVALKTLPAHGAPPAALLSLSLNLNSNVKQLITITIPLALFNSN